MSDQLSLKQRLARMTTEERERFMASLSDSEAFALLNSWAYTARPSQLPPESDWFIWLLMFGRGGGKSRSASEYVVNRIKTGEAKEIALVGETIGDTRRVMVHGPSGVLRVAKLRGVEAEYRVSTAEVLFPKHGAVAYLFSADAGESLRGPEFDTAWADEIAKWGYPKDEDADAWNNLLMATRAKYAGDREIIPRVVASSTPRQNSPRIKELLNDPATVVSHGSTYDNFDNLAPHYQRQMIERYGGTRRARQELYGEFIEDNADALWKGDDIDTPRVRASDVPHLDRIVVAVDPAVSTNKGSDFTAITVVGIATVDGKTHFYVLHSELLKASPHEWASRVRALYEKYSADRIVAEANNGGDLVQFNIHSVDDSLPVTIVRASNGKSTRAEPIASLYEQHRVHHVGEHKELEDQMLQFPNGKHDDGVDSLVWGVTDLNEKSKPKGRFWTMATY